MDDIELLFESSDWKSYNDEVSENISRAQKIPKNEEVDRIELRRADDSARLALERYKKKYSDKMSTVKEKMAKVKDEQKDLETNLIKFNAFVKEKQLKVERGIKTEKEEKALRNQMTEDIENKEGTMVELTKARVKISFIKQNIHFFMIISRNFWKVL